MIRIIGSPSASGWTVATCRDSRNSPTNLIKHNPAFGGRVHELIELRHALNENC